MSKIGEIYDYKFDDDFDNGIIIILDEKSYVYLSAEFFEFNNQNINEYIENENENENDEINLFATKLTDSDYINIDGYIGMLTKSNFEKINRCIVEDDF